MCFWGVLSRLDDRSDRGCWICPRGVRRQLQNLFDLHSKLTHFAIVVFIFEASFEKDDFAYDWVVRYLAEQKTWSNSRVFRVRVANPFTEASMALESQCPPSTKEKESEQKEDDGRPKQMYHPAPDAPVFLRWKGYWIQVNMDLGQYNYGSGSYGNVLTLRCVLFHFAYLNSS